MSYFETDYVCINYVAKFKTVEVVWKLASTTTDQYREAIFESQNLVMEQDVDNLLADMRLQGRVSEEDRLWIRQVVLPQLELVGLKRFAFIYTGNEYSRMAALGMVDTMSTMNFEVQHFDKTESVYEWFKYYL